MIMREIALKFLAFSVGLILLMATAAGAATRHVAVNGSCANHGAAGADFVSCSDSRQAGCTEGKPCCEYQDAMDLTAASDTIEVHHGTFTDGVGFTDNGTYGRSGATYAIHVNRAGVTLKAASGDTPVLDLRTVMDAGVLISVDNVTVEGLTIRNGNGWTSGGRRLGHITLYNYAGIRNPVLRNNTLTVPSNHRGTTAEHFCVYARYTSDLLIEGNTCEGGHDFSFWVHGTADDGDVIIRNNVTIADGRDGIGTQRGIMLQALGDPSHTGKIVIYNNRHSQAATSGATYGMYIRELHWDAYVFNNIFEGVQRGINFQDDLCTGVPAEFHRERWFIFNNTFFNGDNGAGVRWPESVEAQVSNNIFDRFSSGAYMHGSNPAEVCSPRDDVRRSTTNSAFTNALCYNNPACYNMISGSQIRSADLHGLDPVLNADGFIQSGSGAIGRGNNNPLGQGANVCSVQAIGQNINCTVDIEGESRGTVWDIGADEFNGVIETGPIDAPSNVDRAYKRN